MEQIKSVTLQSVEYFSEVLSKKTTKATKHEVQYKILDFISLNGNKNFIDFYNNAFSKNNFEEVFRILNI